MIKAVLLFFIRGDQILLCRKARGFGEGYWNGVGGKCEPGETLEQTVVRESLEEISATPISFSKVAHNQFIFDENDDSKNWDVHVYVCREWGGEFTESDELVEPTWFAFNDIPYSDMWEDDQYWLPQVLDGKFTQSTFWFGGSHNIIKKQVKTRVLSS